ncbi:secretory pathway Sec39 [Microthyrium microscopicum]|uniref:Secretory pathway Sec39 n=1 Tax=Microthyrium microscopicum TaxID=703497 RepID=A0A6A6TUV5_9PEZI|nr:secretory pathway Sec39 [Microthyrium microscopicum]
MSAPNTNPKSLSADHCLLLAAHFASESNISSLNTIASLRPDALNTSLLLQIILTYLPEAIEPEQYVGFIDTALHGGLSALDISSTDLDLGGYVDSISSDDQELAQSYIQTAFASIYASELGSKQAAAIAWRILGRIGALMDIHDELPDLEDQAEQLSGLTDPKLEIKELPNAILDPESLLRKDHPLTAVSKNNLLSAQYFILSTFLLMHYGQSLSVIGTVKCKFHLDKEEQSIMFQKLLHHLATTSNRSDSEWMETRRRLLWLWGWGSEITDSETGNGIFGKASRKTIEKDILEALVQSGSYSTVTNLYIKGSEKFLLPEEAEQVIASTALHYYDNASNGNRHRGTMKKASDIIAAFAKYYPKSTTFPRLQALLAATHAMSSYSLTLQHGVPFQPVNIRVSSDPLSLIEKILSQNPGSYAKATDLVSIGTNLIAAGLTASADDPPISKASLETRQSAAQRRVIGMAIEAALAEDDFETAYSYVVNRLDTSSATMHAPTTSSDDDDIAWRAALAAGKHKSNSSAAPNTRRLEQRMDLLSQALLLAPPSALPEILSAWRRCEEEMSAVLAAEAATEAELDEGLVPGAYIESAAPVQARREVGRGANEEAPMGLFDVARGAAGAFAKSAFPLRGGQGTQPVQVVDTVGSDGEMGSDDGMGRVRRRDMVASAVSGGASAVTGGIASGLGWVLGATPVQNPPRQ